MFEVNSSVGNNLYVSTVDVDNIVPPVSSIEVAQDAGSVQENQIVDVSVIMTEPAPVDTNAPSLVAEQARLGIQDVNDPAIAEHAAADNVVVNETLWNLINNSFCCIPVNLVVAELSHPCPENPICAPIEIPSCCC